MTGLLMRYFPEWQARLLIPYTMSTVKMCEIMANTNGCGRDGIEGVVVPDTLWGLDVSPVCRIHDWMYMDAETEDDEQDADAVLAANMVEFIKQRSANKFMVWLRLRRAYKYINAVTLTDVVDVETTMEITHG